MFLHRIGNPILYPSRSEPPILRRKVAMPPDGAGSRQFVRDSSQRLCGQSEPLHDLQYGGGERTQFLTCAFDYGEPDRPHR
jgi:hypothetical protein